MLLVGYMNKTMFAGAAALSFLAFSGLSLPALADPYFSAADVCKVTEAMARQDYRSPEAVQAREELARLAEDTAESTALGVEVVNEFIAGITAEDRAALLAAQSKDADSATLRSGRDVVVKMMRSVDELQVNRQSVVCENAWKGAKPKRPSPVPPGGASFYPSAVPSCEIVGKDGTRTDSPVASSQGVVLDFDRAGFAHTDGRLPVSISFFSNQPDGFHQVVQVSLKDLARPEGFVPANPRRERVAKLRALLRHEQSQRGMLAAFAEAARVSRDGELIQGSEEEWVAESKRVSHCTNEDVAALGPGSDFMGVYRSLGGINPLRPLEAGSESAPPLQAKPTPQAGTAKTP